MVNDFPRNTEAMTVKTVWPYACVYVLCFCMCVYAGACVGVRACMCVCAPRPPVLSAVHSEYDGCGEDLSLAVHRVQVLQPVWHL